MILIGLLSFSFIGGSLNPLFIVNLLTLVPIQQLAQPR